MRHSQQRWYGESLLVDDAILLSESTKPAQLRIESDRCDCSHIVRPDHQAIVGTHKAFHGTPRPIRRRSRAIGPPPGTLPPPTSTCPRIAFSRAGEAHVEARSELRSQHGCTPQLILAMDKTGARSGRRAYPVGPAVQWYGWQDVGLWWDPRGIIRRVFDLMNILRSRCPKQPPSTACRILFAVIIAFSCGIRFRTEIIIWQEGLFKVHAKGTVDPCQKLLSSDGLNLRLCQYLCF